MFPHSKLSRSKSSVFSLNRSSSTLSSASVFTSSSNSVKKTHAYKLSSLYEIEYFPNFDSIPIQKLLFLNPYHVHRNSLSSLTRSIQTLINPPQDKAKEYVQCSKFDSHQRLASSSEQFVQVEIPNFLISQWHGEAFIHIHVGGIRFALTYHARKGLPVTPELHLLILDYLSMNVLASAQFKLPSMLEQ